LATPKISCGGRTDKHNKHRRKSHNMAIHNAIRELFEYTTRYRRHSDETNLVCNVKSIVIWRQSYIGLLGPVRANQGVDFGRLNIIQLLHCILNLPLVRLEVGDENEGVVLLDFLHRGLGVQR